MLTVILNGHREKQLLTESFHSIESNVRILNRKEIPYKVIIVLDNACEKTEEYIIQSVSNSVFKEKIQIENVNFSNLSHSRNHGVNMAEHGYIAFLDGDDIWGENWLWKAYKLRDLNTIYHPEYSFYFGNTTFIHHHIGMSDSTFDIDLLRITSYWTSLAFAHRDILLKIPYKPINLSEGIGYEDWTWNCDTIAQGYKHEIIKDTVHFIRNKKSESLLQETDRRISLPHQNNLFHKKNK